jgi:glycosyltransferase involved in cell wall biosynthesis
MSGNDTNQVKTRVHLAPSLDYGGLETQLTTLGTEYNKTGRTNTVEFWSLRTGGISEIKLRKLGFTVRVLNANFRTMNPALVLKLVYLFRKAGVNEVFTHGFESNLNGIIAARLAGIRCVIAEEIGISKHKHLLHFAFKLNYMFVKKMSVQSQQMKISIEKSNEISLKKVVVIYPPVEIDRILRQDRQLSSGALKFVFIGRLEKVKNLSLMLESLYRLKNQNKISNWTLNIYGSGSEAKNLQELVLKLDLQTNIAFKGMTSAALEAISEADWMLLSSESEGFGLVIIESMLCGVPVISTKVGIAEEIIISNKNGYLSPDHSINSYLNCLLNVFTMTNNDYRNISNEAISSAKGRFNSEAYLMELDKLVEPAN